MPRSPLSFFDPLIKEWFQKQIGTPTDIQEKAWPEIVQGNHVLVTAPTGSGKTLTAFLWGLNQLLTGAWHGGTVRLLYVSPLKALNNDVQRNLLRPLSELTEFFGLAGVRVPGITVLTRSGDTPGDERRRMARMPPEILITTPESLNLLLTSRSGRGMLAGIATVILDEIHAVAGSKRGTHLITAVDRLVPLAGEFQRIALSATVKPLDQIAAFVGGYRPTGTGVFLQRPVSIVTSDQAKEYQITVAFPSDKATGQEEAFPDHSWWPSLISAFKRIIDQHHSTLLFTNSRRHAEKVTRLINEGEPREVAYAHHGSLAREIRLAIEQKLKNGELKAIVATNSLELGIDVGSLDQVILVQTPRAVSSAVQRIGRSGHDVGEQSRGVLFPIHGRDFVDAAVMARAVLDRDIEAVKPIDAPLDILAQVILSMTATEQWNISSLYDFLRTSYPYRDLTRRRFDLVLDMLNGKYADSRLRELKGRVSLDRIDNTIQAHHEVPFLLYSSGGTIPERGYFDLRLKDNRAKIGELDEEFVWERSIGETFTLGTQLWRIEKITHNDVEVVPVRESQGIFPFWRAEEQNRDFHFSEKIADFLEHADGEVESPRFRDELRERHCMDEAAADELIAFLKLQKQITRSSLPHRHHLLIEHVEDRAGRTDLKPVILHTFWGGKINRPFALALEQAWEEQQHSPLQIIEDDDALLLLLPHEVGIREVLRLVSPETVEVHLRKKLESTGFFGARFRENAERALLLPRPDFKRRMPLWLIRLRAKELLGVVQRYEDFPILLETWRTCLEDEFDLEHLKIVLDELRDNSISITETRTQQASPFAGRLAWKQENISVYEDDTPLLARQSALRPDLVKEVLFSSRLRPKIPAELIRALDEKLKRTAPGYTPASEHELLDWIKDRALMPEPEWNALAASVWRDQADPAEWLPALAKKTAWISWPGVADRMLVALETLPKVLVAFRLLPEDITISPVSLPESSDSVRRRVRAYLRGEHPAVPEEYDLSRFLAVWLACYGPITKKQLEKILGVTRERLDEALEPLIEAGTLIMDLLSEESREPEICDSQNLEMLLRTARRRRRPSFQALPQEKLALFCAVYQGIAQKGETLEDLQQRLEQLFGWPAPADAWEEYLLPSRMQQYRNESLDALINSTDLIWFGCGVKRISLAFESDLELFRGDHAEDGSDGELANLIPDRRGRYSFFEITEHAHMDVVHAAELLWKEAWKGHVTSDSFKTVRKGIVSRFRPGDLRQEPRFASRRAGFDRWKASRPIEGHWLRIDLPAHGQDVLEQEELIKDRVRQLFRRYGLLFRELLANELPLLQWRAVFRSLRLMELSGEVLSGYFFQGIPGPQFISPEAFRMIREPMPDDTVYWINAADPASLCGLGLESPGLPARLPSTHLIYRGSRVVMISRRLGRSLEIMTAADDPGLHDYFGLFRQLLGREFDPVSRISVEQINGEPAKRSRFAGFLKKFGFRSARNSLELWKEYP